MSAKSNALIKAPPTPAARTLQPAPLQRTCACGQHTVAGGVCASCNHQSVRARQLTDGNYHDRSHPTASGGIGQAASGDRQRTSQVANLTAGHDFSMVPARTVASPSGAGQPLPTSVRSAMEAKLHVPLASVRVHTDSSSARMAKKHRANALSIGEHVHFGKGKYRPFDAGGQKLLAHEITHVLQQRNAGGGGSVAASEREADTFSQSIASASALPPVEHKIGASLSAPLLNKSKARELIEDEIDDVFFGIDNAWDAIRSATQNERDEILADKVIERNIRRRADPMDLLKTYLLLTYGKEELFPAHFQALIEATDKLGTDEARIFAMLRGVTQPEREEIQNMPGAVEVIEDEMSGDELQLGLNLLYGKEEKSGTAMSSARESTHLEKGERYSLALGARASFEDVQYELKQASRKSGQRDAILADTALWAQIEDEFDTEEVWYLRMLARYAEEANFPVADTQKESFVKIIWESVKITGTDEDKLIGGLRDLNNAASFTSGSAVKPVPSDEVKDDPWFVPTLQSELSGDDLKNAMSAVSATEPSQVGIRKDLKKAIKKADMATIRSLLTDAKLTSDDRLSLNKDAGIIEEMGDSLNPVQLCEASQLLLHGASIPKLVSDLLAYFQKTPVDVASAESYLKGLGAADQLALEKEPGVYYMIVDPKKKFISFDDRAKLLAAIKSNDPKWQTQGSEGTHYTVKQSVRTELPVSFTSSEARIQVRMSLDASNIPKTDNKPYRVSTGTIEEWTRMIDGVWNGKYRLRSGKKKLSLVFDAYIAHDIPPPNVPVTLYNEKGRSRANYRGMFLYLKGQPSEDNLPAETVAHEFGHVVGNPDEYKLTPADYLKFTGEKGKTPRGGQDVGGLMSDQRESLEISERHAAPAVEIINAVRDTTVYPDPFVIDK